MNFGGLSVKRHSPDFFKMEGKSMKYYGAIGFKVYKETEPGVCDPDIMEVNYAGDVNRLTRRQEAQSESINDTNNVSEEISIVADPFAYQNFSSIEYITWLGQKWTVSSVAVQPPRLILQIGGVYNGG